VAEHGDVIVVQPPGEREEKSQSGNGPEEQPHREGRKERFGLCWIGAGMPSVEQAAGKADAGSKGDTKESHFQAFFPAAPRDEERARQDRVKRHHAEEERERSGEFEEHGRALLAWKVRLRRERAGRSVGATSPGTHSNPVSIARAILAFGLFEQGQQVPTAMHDSLDADSVLTDTKENDVLPHRRKPCIAAKLGT